MASEHENNALEQLIAVEEREDELRRQRRAELITAGENPGIIPAPRFPADGERCEMLETFIFFRESVFYPVEIPRSQILENVELNPGTLRVEDIQGTVVWRPQ